MSKSNYPPINLQILDSATDVVTDMGIHTITDNEGRKVPSISITVDTPVRGSDITPLSVTEKRVHDVISGINNRFENQGYSYLTITLNANRRSFVIEGFDDTDTDRSFAGTVAAELITEFHNKNLLSKSSATTGLQTLQENNLLDGTNTATFLKRVGYEPSLAPSPPFTRSR